jgi:hypothetical protein
MIRTWNLYEEPQVTIRLQRAPEPHEQAEDRIGGQGKPGV